MQYIILVILLLSYNLKILKLVPTGVSGVTTTTTAVATTTNTTINISIIYNNHRYHY